MELQAFLPTEKLDGIGFCHLEKVVIIVFIVVISIEKEKVFYVNGDNDVKYNI